MANDYFIVRGEKITIQPIPISELPVIELQQTVGYFNRYGYYNGESLQETHNKYYDKNHFKFHSFQDWIKESGLKL